MKFLKRFLITLILIAVILSAFYFLWISPRYVVPILMYHRFGDKDTNLFVTPESFYRQMKYLKDNNYKVISLDELVEGIKNKREFNHKTVVITIDDGYEDNFLYGYPVLKEFDFPATIFIAANHINNKKDFMNWLQVKVMAKDTISFGAHTKNEAYLPSITNEKELRDEIFGAKEIIEQNLGIPVDYFCYPTGGFTEEVKAMVKEAGYKGACTTNRGFANLNEDIYELKRVKVKNSDTVKAFSFPAKLSGYYNLFRHKKSGY
ncbi:MAG: polysaccharide deacetylase family protein [Candidatus Omnitrophota bacterium]